MKKYLIKILIFTISFIFIIPYVEASEKDNNKKSDMYINYDYERFFFYYFEEMYFFEEEDIIKKEVYDLKKSTRKELEDKIIIRIYDYNFSYYFTLGNDNALDGKIGSKNPLVDDEFDLTSPDYMRNILLYDKVKLTQKQANEFRASVQDLLESNWVDENFSFDGDYYNLSIYHDGKVYDNILSHFEISEKYLIAKIREYSPVGLNLNYYTIDEYSRERFLDQQAAEFKGNLQKSWVFEGIYKLAEKWVNQSSTNGSKKLKKGSTVNLKFKHDQSDKKISKYELNAIAYEAKKMGYKSRAHFDRMTSQNSETVDVRITIDPSKANKTLNLLGYTYNKDERFQFHQLGYVFKRFNNRYSNVITAIYLNEPSSDYGMTVNVAARTSAEKAKSAYVYSYDNKTKKFELMKNAKAKIDNGGYVHFETDIAGYFIVSEGKLKKR